MKNGEPVGYNRYIDGERDISMIGYFDDSLKRYGTHLEFMNKQLLRSGHYERDTEKFTPLNPIEFLEFSEEPLNST